MGPNSSGCRVTLDVLNIFLVISSLPYLLAYRGSNACTHPQVSPYLEFMCARRIRAAATSSYLLKCRQLTRYYRWLLDLLYIFAKCRYADLVEAPIARMPECRQSASQYVFAAREPCHTQQIVPAPGGMMAFDDI
jgi:hypothetical protein